MIHLYWLYRRKECWHRLGIGFSVCGRRLPRSELTRFPDDNECPACREKSARDEKTAPTVSAT